MEDSKLKLQAMEGTALSLVCLVVSGCLGWRAADVPETQVEAEWGGEVRVIS